MSVIHGQQTLATGMDNAAEAIRQARARFTAGSASVARQGVARSPAASAKEAENSKPPGQTPPNPGPPGGAQPADLVQAMAAQSEAGQQQSANVKTLQAFDAMLAELSRMSKPR